MTGKWDAERVLALSRGYQVASVLGAAVDLDLFSVLADGALSAGEVARRIDADPRATRTLLDALGALELLHKEDEVYSLAPGVGALLTPDGEETVLAMTRLQANCARRWMQLAAVVKNGIPTARVPSIRGADADAAVFIEAMNDVSGPLAPTIFEELGPLEFRCSLDIGGGSGTWTIALLRAHPEARGILFDLPHVIPMAEGRLTAEGLIDRVELAAGDFERDPLPQGADLVWLSAIIHQNSPEQNHRLYTSIHEALEPGGQLLIRDLVMEESRTAPASGALFAINMLVATVGGGTFTLSQMREELEAAGFTDVRWILRREDMSSVISARKPG